MRAIHGICLGLCALAAVFVMGGDEPVSAGNGQQAAEAGAVAMDVKEGEGSVSIDVIAYSRAPQRVAFTVELFTGNTSRHSGETSVGERDRVVLSTLKANITDGWCARLKVREEHGREYTHLAGDCARFGVSATE